MNLYNQSCEEFFQDYENFYLLNELLENDMEISELNGIITDSIEGTVCSQKGVILCHDEIGYSTESK